MPQMRPRAEDGGPDPDQRRPLRRPPRRRRRSCPSTAREAAARSPACSSSRSPRGRRNAAARRACHRPAPWSSGRPRRQPCSSRSVRTRSLPGSPTCSPNQRSVKPALPACGAGVDLQQQPRPVPVVVRRSARCAAAAPASRPSGWPRTRPARAAPCSTCRRPTMCHSASGTASILGIASWTRFSPKRLRPGGLRGAHRGNVEALGDRHQAQPSGSRPAASAAARRRRSRRRDAERISSGVIGGSSTGSIGPA